MDNITKSLDFLKIPNPFREVIFTVGGFLFLVFIQFRITDIVSELKFLGLGRIEDDIVLIMLSFILGRLLFIINNIILFVFDLILQISVNLFFQELSLRNRSEQFFLNWKLQWKRKIREFIREEYPIVGYADVKNEITVLDMARVTKEYPSLSSEIERTVYFQIFLKVSSSLLLIMSIYISSWCLFFLFLLSFSFSLIEAEMIRHKEYLIYRGVVKETGKKTESKLN